MVPVPIPSDSPLPTLYKVMKRKRANELLTAGKILVGTLAGFRNEEAHESGIGDKGEGTITYVADDWAPSGDVNIPGLRLRGLAPEQVRFRGGGFRGRTEAWIYCLSGTPNPTPLPANYDTVLEILDAQRFIDCITEALRPDARGLTFIAMKRCVYGGRAQRLDETRVLQGQTTILSDDWYRKPASFSGQVEYRAAWALPATINPLAGDPIPLEIPELCTLVREYVPTGSPAVADGGLGRKVGPNR